VSNESAPYLVKESEHDDKRHEFVEPLLTEGYLVVRDKVQPPDHQTLREKLEQALDASYVKIGALNVSREQGMPLITDVLLDTICEHITSDRSLRDAMHAAVQKAEDEFDAGRSRQLDRYGAILVGIAQALREKV
jgi:hypothetical protein